MKRPRPISALKKNVKTIFRKTKEQKIKKATTTIWGGKPLGISDVSLDDAFGFYRAESPSQSEGGSAFHFYTQLSVFYLVTTFYSILIHLSCVKMTQIVGFRITYPLTLLL